MADNEPVFKKFTEYEIDKVGDGIWRINDFNLSSLFVVEGEKKALVLDCGAGSGDLRGAIAGRITDKELILAATHAHVDHIGGRGQWDKMYIGHADVPYVAENTPKLRKGYMDFYRLNSMLADNGVTVWPAQYDTIAEPVYEGDKIDLGGRVLEVIETPGHTIGSVCYLDRQTRTLFTGDVVNDYNFMWLPHTSTVRQLVHTFEKLQALEGYDTIWPCHTDRSYTRELLRRGLACAVKVTQKPALPLPIIKKEVYDGFSIIYRTDVVG